MCVDSRAGPAISTVWPEGCIINGPAPNLPGALAHTKPTSFKFANKYLKWQEDYGAEFS